MMHIIPRSVLNAAGVVVRGDICEGADGNTAAARQTSTIIGVVADKFS